MIHFILMHGLFGQVLSWSKIVKVLGNNFWMAIIIRHDFSLLDDTPSKSPNLKGFQEHRHDQAIFSLLFEI